MSCSYQQPLYLHTVKNYAAGQLSPFDVEKLFQHNLRNISVRTISGISADNKSYLGIQLDIKKSQQTYVCMYNVGKMN